MGLSEAVVFFAGEADAAASFFWMQQTLYFLPLPQGHGWLRPTLVIRHDSVQEEHTILYPKLFRDVRFYELLQRFDEDVAADERDDGCLLCGGVLHSAIFPRKPRGSLCKLPDGYDARFSFCCAENGCRRRRTPPSLRFLGRRVYLGAVVVLASAMQQGVTPMRAQRVHELIGASMETLVRWREWWREAFVRSDFWKMAKARFSPPADENGFSLSLLERFGNNEQEQERLVLLLRFLKPLSTSTGYVADQRL